MSRFINGIEILFAFLTLFILLNFIYQIIREKHDNEINITINNIRSHGEMMEKYISTEYKMSIDQAISQIEKLKSSLIGIVYYLIDNSDKK
jgi:ABC-type uncharacterized transport system permease subunit